MSTQDGFQGVSNCYIFKSRLQKYSQKLGFLSPVYETIKEGASHEPSFRSEVIVNGARYKSLLGFSNRKAAEQSAAEVALMELAKDNDNLCFYQPVIGQYLNKVLRYLLLTCGSGSVYMKDETGFCKNLLQEYAQKMNYAIPLYHCQKDESAGRATLYSCSVEVGGIRCIGAVAKTKKEAEIKAARTALLAIRSSTTDLSSYNAGCSQLTVIPSKKRGIESVLASKDASAGRKTKRSRPKKNNLRKKLPEQKIENARESISVNPKANMNDEVTVNLEVLEPEIKAMSPGLFPSEPMNNAPNEISACTFDFSPVTDQGDKNPQLGALISNQTGSSASPAVDNRISGIKHASVIITTPMGD